MNTCEPRLPDDEHAIALLVDLVSIYSPSTQEAGAVRLLVRRMGEWGFDAQVDAAGSAVGHLGQGDRRLVLLGHIDTAPGEPPVLRDGCLLYGRGTVDAKGPLAAFAVAAARAGVLSRLAITVIGAVEEEAATSAGAYYAVEQYHPDFCIIGEPSGWNRVALGYKGRLLVDYSLDRAVSHTAGQERSACEEAVRFWLRVLDWAQAYNEGKPTLFEQLDPSLRSICSSSDGLRERVAMTVALRLPLGLDVPSLVQRVMDDWRGTAQVTTHAYEEPFRADKRNALTSAFLASIRAEGGSPAFLTKTGTSDMNVVGPRWCCPVVAYGPGDSSLDHTPGEHIDLDEYLASIRVLSRVLRRLGE
jgi:LysW-gamma-L-lysine carboxypeptidase